MKVSKIIVTHKIYIHPRFASSIYLISRLLTTFYNHPKALKYFSTFFYRFFCGWCEIYMSWHHLFAYRWYFLRQKSKEKKNILFSDPINTWGSKQKRECERETSNISLSQRSYNNSIRMLKISLMPSGVEWKKNLNKLFLNKSNKAKTPLWLEEREREKRKK